MSLKSDCRRCTEQQAAVGRSLACVRSARLLLLAPAASVKTNKRTSSASGGRRLRPKLHLASGGLVARSSSVQTPSPQSLGLTAVTATEARVRVCNITNTQATVRTLIDSSGATETRELKMQDWKTCEQIRKNGRRRTIVYKTPNVQRVRSLFMRERKIQLVHVKYTFRLTHFSCSTINIFFKKLFVVLSASSGLVGE